MADMLERIGNLLRKAERTDSEAERDALLDKAQQLSTTYSIDMAMARKATLDKEKRQVPITKRIPIGQRGKVGLGTYVELMMAIGHANNVRFDIARNSVCVWAYGFAQDIEVTEAIYATVLPQMVRESDAYMRKGEYRSEVVWRKGTKKYTDYWGDVHSYVDWGYFPVAGRAARLHFQSTYAATIRRRLMAAKHTAVETAIKGHGTGAELALRAAELDVTDFYKRQSTAKGSWKGSQASDGGAGARAAGEQAGHRARLGTETAIGGHRKQVSA